METTIKGLGLYTINPIVISSICVYSHFHVFDGNFHVC